MSAYTTRALVVEGEVSGGEASRLALGSESAACGSSGAVTGDGERSGGADEVDGDSVETVMRGVDVADEIRALELGGLLRPTRAGPR